MKYTSAQANKLLKKLNDEYSALLDKEQRSRDFRAAMGEDIESVRPAYDYAKTQARLEELEGAIRRLKHAINRFNTTQVVDGFGITIDEMLVYIPQLTKRKSKLLEMKSRLPKERVEEQYGRQSNIIDYTYTNYDLAAVCSATSFLRNWDSILEKKRANLRSISEPARLRQPPPRSTGAAHARGRAQSIREERRIAAPPVLFALLWVRLLPALYGPFCGPLRPFGGCPWGVTPPARECLPPAPPDTRRRG